MPLKKFKIAFVGNWGTAYEILKTLYKSNQIELCFVITQNKKDSVNDVWFNLVNDFAKNNNIIKFDQKLFYKNDNYFLEIIKKYNIDLIVSVAYPYLISKTIINFMKKKLGIVNIHGSLLPKYRGTTPVPWAIINQEKYLGVTLHYIDSGCDTGDIIFQKKIKNLTYDTIDNITEKLKHCAVEIFKDYLNAICQGKRIKRIAQNHSNASYAFRLKDDNLLLNFNKNKNQILAFVRGTEKYKIFIKYFGKKIYISKVNSTDVPSSFRPNSIVSISKNSLTIASKDYDLVINFENIFHSTKFEVGKLINV